MRTDHYARSGRRWALGAELVYRPIAAELVAMSPHSDRDYDASCPPG